MAASNHLDGWLLLTEWSLAEDDDIEVTSLVKEVIKAKRNVSNVMNNIEYLGFMKDMNEAWEDSRSLTLTSVFGLRYYEVDFGWGKPVWLSNGSISVPNGAFLSDTRDGEGVEAWVALYEEDMDKFEKNPSIMAYASSNPSILIEKAWEQMDGGRDSIVPITKAALMEA
ncbi:hypothetical protein WN944_023438 [Citrus x changshan-huyou]|uniref:Uncharacterized protein n=1 Tax=Citrus x changshan-huyou TaxID=2935761 RepID=A0AAP0N2C9_9ROSI